MCGIAGLISRVSLFAPSSCADALQPMLDAISHRGPDGNERWSNGHLFMGHRRLSIIDLTGGTQPMLGDSGCVITYNGEIYNYIELRDELIAKGERFKTQSDTEVLLRLYEREGADCVDRLVGMFAFAIWDPHRNKVFFARDRLGKKPLYIHVGDEGMAFASEIKALTHVPWLKDKLDIDLCSISDYLSLGYILSPKTAFKQVFKLPAASMGWWNPENGEFSSHEYWKVEEFFKADKLENSKRTVERFDEIFNEAIMFRLRSDVPVAAYVSGGLDSVAVASRIKRAVGGENVKGFAIGFADPSYDESRFATAAARHIGMDIRVEELIPATRQDLQNIVWHADEPFADTSIVPTYLLNKVARKEYKVAISGDGADEILAGYATHSADRLFSYWSRFPGPLKKAAHVMASKMLPPSYRKVSWDYKLQKFLAAHVLSPQEAHYSWRSIFGNSEKNALFSDGALSRLGDYEPYDTYSDLYERVRGADFLDQCLFVDIKTWLQDDILVKVDRMSMANSIEVRCPFLDHRLVEFSAQLPIELKMTMASRKKILRQVVADEIPRSILKRGKQGFTSPTRHFGFNSVPSDNGTGIFRPGFELNPSAEDVTYKSFVFGVLDNWMEIYGRFKKGQSWSVVS